MCIEKQALNYLCELFPRTAENITKRSIERRKQFIAQKRTNSKSFYEKMILKGEHKRFIDNQSTTKKIDVKGDPYLHQFSDEDEYMSDEGADINLNAQTSDMKEHLNSQNSRIETLLNALTEVDNKLKGFDQASIQKMVNLKRSGSKVNGFGPDEKSISDVYK